MSFEIIPCEVCNQPTPIPPTCETCGRRVCGPCLVDDHQCLGCINSATVVESEPLSNQDANDETNEIPPMIRAELVDSFNYASWQNSIPLLKLLSISHEKDCPLDNLSLELESTPCFFVPKKWSIDQISANSTFEISDRDLELDLDYLNGLNESEKGYLKFKLTSSEEVLDEITMEIRILARDEWCGLSSTGEMIASFVMPNDPIIAGLLKDAGKILRDHGHSSGLDGYQSGDPNRAYLLASALWSVMTAKELTYANPPKSFESMGQKTRSPSVVLSQGLATCLDSSLLFASAMEGIGLNPVIIFVEGHCFLGVWLIENTFNRTIETDISEVRKAISAQEMVVFETTLICDESNPSLDEAMASAELLLREEEEHKFVACVDIQRARMLKIRPLASHNKTPQENNSPPENPMAVKLSNPKNFSPKMDQPIFDKPKTPNGRIERWQGKLLDLTLRNRLLHFKDSKQTIPFYGPDISLLEDRLASGKKVKVKSIEEDNPLGERDAEIHRKRSKEDIVEEYAKVALGKGEIISRLKEAELKSRLTTLYRTVKNDFSEGGTNTLFLAIGFLRWKQKETEDRVLKAPLLLMPVKLQRTSARSPYQLLHHEDELRFNATLIQLLKRDYDCDLTHFESDLPKDAKGVDVDLILDGVRQKIRSVPGFEVVEEIALARFSFAKYLMWKDMVDRIDQLEVNPVVRHLIRDPDKVFQPTSDAPFPEANHIDYSYDPSELFYPLPTDSTQLTAVLAASEGKDFVLIGPPGTGKSQTIANMIAQCLANRKTVLFVAEKTAALDVVYRRLKEHGLGDVCLELHSNKADRKNFLNQLDKSWKIQLKQSDCEWLDTNSKLKKCRDHLNEYVFSLHKSSQKDWTAFKALGLSISKNGNQAPVFNPKKSNKTSAIKYSDLLEVVADLELHFDAIDPTVQFSFVRGKDWSLSWQETLLQRAKILEGQIKDFLKARDSILDELGIIVREQTYEQLEQIKKLAVSLIETAEEDYRVIFDKQLRLLPEYLDLFDKNVSELSRLEKKTKARYSLETVPEIPLIKIDESWREANSKLWPFSYFAELKVRKYLETFAESGQAEVSTDLRCLRKIQELLMDIDQSGLSISINNWNGYATDTSDLRNHLEKAQSARKAIKTVANIHGDLSQFSGKLSKYLTTTHRSHPLLTASNKYLQQFDELERSLAAYAELANCTLFDKKISTCLEQGLANIEYLQTNQKFLKGWLSWCKAVDRALQSGFIEFIEGLESGRIQPPDLKSLFESSYAKSILPPMIDGSPTLRDFQKFKHEKIIQSFGELDDKARAQSSSQIINRIYHHLPKPDQVPRKSELGLLRHQANLKRPSKSIRQLVEGMPTTFSKLAPCLMMSPLSVAQYLPANQRLYDVVIFDEASQITTWDAIGAIARGKQTIIVGDPKQLPPTNFFGKNDEDEGEDLEEYEKDLESILDETKASGLTTLQLNWHYRSKHESLIAFSNRMYYENELTTFPSSITNDNAVSLKHVPDAIYDRGKTRTNIEEAKAIVQDSVSLMRQWLELPVQERPTLGVITFNLQQQSMILDLFDEELVKQPELEWFFSDDRIEPTIVKNLENVQGDERDYMFFSITFGRSVNSQKIPRTFGALNSSGGERRLNVAITRARQSLVVYTSFKPDELSVDGIGSLGVRHLKKFLEFAQRGAGILESEIVSEQDELEPADFIESVRSSLIHLDWNVDLSIGVSNYRIDIGVIDPDIPENYLAGIECDGASYNQSKTARDRDKTRGQVLTHLGWNMLRIWSLDWFHDFEGALKHLDTTLHNLLDERRSERVLCEDNRDNEQALLLESAQPENRKSDDLDFFTIVDLDEFDADPEMFYSEQANDSLRQMIEKTLAAEAPIREDILCQRISRAHGWMRTGARIKNRILTLVKDISQTDEDVGTFYWGNKSISDNFSFRHARSDEDRRSIDGICMPELCGLILANQELLENRDPTLAFARHMGFLRISKSTRARIDEAIQVCDKLSAGMINNKIMQFKASPNSSR